MLIVVLLVAVILGRSGQNILKKAYTKKTGESGVFLSSTIVSISALIFFVVTSNEFNFKWSIVPYSIAFALSYAAATSFNVFAISCGSLSLSSLISSYSLLMPTLYGLFFLKDPIGKWFLFGLILLIISLALINKKDENAGISFKWLVFVAIAFAGNGICSTVQMVQQRVFDGNYKNEFMIIALVIVAVTMSLITVIRERENIAINFKLGWHFSIMCGLLNGLSNLLVMFLANSMSTAILYPLISAGGLIVTYIVSRFFYKEELTRSQFVGFLLGILAVVFLNV